MAHCLKTSNCLGNNFIVKQCLPNTSSILEGDEGLYLPKW